MDQLVVLQEIYESFAKGGESLHSINPNSIEGSSAQLVRRLLEGARQGRIDEGICSRLADDLSDLYEVKRLGDICRKMGMLGVSIKCYNRALSTSRDQNVRSVLLNNLGQVYAKKGDLDQATANYKKAAEGFESLRDNSSLAHVLGNLGSAYRRGCDWDKAVEHCYKSLKIFEKLGDQYGIAQMTGSLGRIYTDMGESDLAVTYYERSLKDFQKLGDNRSSAWVLSRLGRIHAAMKNWDASLKCFNKGLALFDELGWEQGSGTVLSHLGRMYLDKGDATAAREQLERAAKLINKDMQPMYQNTVASLAATYSAIAKDYLKKASEVRSKGASRKDDELQKMAAQYYAQSTERYQELASLKSSGNQQIQAAVSMAKTLSYLARMKSEVKEEEAFALADKAISTLEVASASASISDKATIDAILKTITGMREALAAGKASAEPWRLSRSVSDSIECLMSGASLISSKDEACSILHDALRNLNDALDKEAQRGDSSELLRAAAYNLRRAETGFESKGTDLGKESAAQVGLAAQFVERLAGVEIENGKTPALSKVSDILNYRAHRMALIQIGWTVLKNMLSAADRTDYIYSWDEAMNLIEARPVGQPELKRSELGRGPDVHSKIDVKAENQNPAKANTEIILEPVAEYEPDFVVEPVEKPLPGPSYEPEPGTARAFDGSSGSQGLVLEAPPTDTNWLVPVNTALVRSSRSTRRSDEATSRASNSSRSRIVEINRFSQTQKGQIIDRGHSACSESAAIDEIIVESSDPIGPAIRDYSCKGSEDQAKVADRSEAGTSSSEALDEAWKSLNADSERGKVSSRGGRLSNLIVADSPIVDTWHQLVNNSNAVKMIKVLAIVVVVLLAIDVILYLI